MQKLQTLIFKATFGVVMAFACEARSQLVTASFAPSGRTIAPFGYGSVQQYFVPTSGRTGSNICTSFSQALHCISVSGGSQCAALAPVGSVVSCNSASQPAVDETALQPINCNGHALGDGGVSGLLGSNEFCLTANYMPQRTADTVYQYDDYVRLGVNQRFGGMIAELYGTDKVDRILQNGGGSVQLSLWAFTTSYAPASYSRAYFAVGASPGAPAGTYDPTAFPTTSACQTAHPGLTCVAGVEGPNEMTTPAVYPCAGNTEGAGAPINPIQGQSTNCNYGDISGAIGSIQSTAPGQITFSKSGPANFSRSDSIAWLNWHETSRVQGPAAIVTYQLAGTATIPDVDFQEIPAIFLHQGLGAQIYFYAGQKPYNDVNGNVLTADITKVSGALALQLPNRVGPFGTGADAMLTEDWISTCNATGNQCFTVASFSGTAQDLIASFSTEGSYFGVHGFFSLTNNLNRTATIVMFPYRFDDIVQGRSIRSWIYSMRSNPQMSK